MNSPLLTLARQTEDAVPTDIPRPPSRWKTRVLVPATIVVGTLGLLAYSARGTLQAVTAVQVIPVITDSPAGAGANEGTNTAGNAPRIASAPTLLVQAPGWIEPAPYSTIVPALAEGVVHEVLVLEGDRVDAGQVIARLIDRDAQLAVDSAEAQLAGLQGAKSKAEADIRAAEARLADVDDQLVRTRKLAATGGAPESQLAGLQFRHSALQEELAAAKAVHLSAISDVRMHEVACTEARLNLERMQIVSPISGVVMARFVEPGSRISMNSRQGSSAASESMGGAIARLYDPRSLQVRVDVPLADCAKVQVGSVAEVVTEAVPDKVFRGAVTRVIHEANIQRNTVQVKVAIEDPVETLKPEMLARVRFYSSPASTSSLGRSQDSVAAHGSNDSAQSGGFQAQSGLRLLIPEQVVLDRSGNAGRVWVVEHETKNQTTVAADRKIVLETTNRTGLLAVTDGLRPGDRMIFEPPRSLRPGMRVRVSGEAPDGTAGQQGEQK